MRDTIGMILIVLAALGASRRVGGEFGAETLALVAVAVFAVVVAIAIRCKHAIEEQTQPGATAVSALPTGCSSIAVSERTLPDSSVRSNLAEQPVPTKHKEGIAEVAFAAGQKTAVVHIPLLPPFPDTPDIECEPLTGCELRWKVVVAQPFGVRLDVTRTGEIGEPVTVQLAWFAVADSPSTKAA